MLCPYFSHTETKVTDKRDGGGITRRRRECLKCARRFSTKESVEHNEIKVIKKNGQREAFDREKIKRGVMRACEKRPVNENQVEMMMNKIEGKIRKKGKEVETKMIGELVSNELKRIDKIAYIRFASVYRDFADLTDFKKEINVLLQKK